MPQNINPRRSRAPRLRSKCPHPDCKGKTAFVDLKRHIDSAHATTVDPRNFCFFCDMATPNGNRSSHIKANHRPGGTKKICPRCCFTWIGTGAGRRHEHQRTCARRNENVGGWVFSIALGVFVRPEVNPVRYWNYYAKAEEASAVWANSLIRLGVPEGESRLDELIDEIERYRAEGETGGGAAGEATGEAEQPEQREHFSPPPPLHPIPPPPTTFSTSFVHDTSSIASEAESAFRLPPDPPRADSSSRSDNFQIPLQHDHFASSPFNPVPVHEPSDQYEPAPLFPPYSVTPRQQPIFPNTHPDLSDPFSFHSHFPDPYCYPQPYHHYSSLSHRKADIYGMLGRLTI